MPSGVVRTPLISERQRRFIEGEITAEQYLEQALQAAEEEARLQPEPLKQRRLRVTVLLMFALIAALVYGATAAIFFVSDYEDGTIAAIILSVLFMATVEILREVRRRVKL